MGSSCCGVGSPETPSLFIFALVTPSRWQAEAGGAGVSAGWQRAASFTQLSLVPLITAALPPPEGRADPNQRLQLCWRRQGGGDPLVRGPGRAAEL